LTKINKIVMRGFKSFATKTELLFGEKFNCVLGPNGSGKSNVLDAICFVLGKSSARSLRAEKSANLVYNGGKTNKPAKAGEVSIFFDNSNNTFPTDMNQVKVTRIIKNNGQSIYKINDKRRTRHEILELLSVAKIDPNGYNIILQGDVVRFVEMHPVQRRNIIEEISGISVYEDKRQSAMKELDKVDEKLNESDIILKERKTYLRELKKERDQALKYQEMADKIKQNKASYLKIQIDRKVKERDKLQENVDDYTTKTEKMNNKIDELRLDNKKLKEQVEEISKEVERKGDIEQRDLNKQIQELNVSITEKRSRINMLENELLKIKNRRESIKSEMGDTEEQIQSFENKLKENEKEFSDKTREMEIIRKKIADFKKKHNLDDAGEIEDEIDSLDQIADEKQKQIMVLRENQQNLIREEDRLRFQIQTFQEKIEKVREVEKENKEQVEDLKNMRVRFKSVTLELNKNLDEDSGISARLGEARKKLLSETEELSKLKARNAGLKDRIAGDLAIKKINENKSHFNGVLGTVSELGNVSSKYALALETAAGPRLKSIVVETDKVAADCIKYLKSNRLGTATFMPLNKIKPKDTEPRVKKLLKSNGVNGLAIDLVEFEPKLKKVFQYIFSNTLVVDNIDVSRRIGIGEAKMVTLDGDMAEISGIMHGGFRKTGSSGYGFKEKEIARGISQSENKITELKDVISVYEKKREELDEKITGFRNEKASLEGEIIKNEKSLHLESDDIDTSLSEKDKLENDLRRVSGEIEHIQGTISKENKELAECKIKKQGMRSKINDMRSPSKLAELNAFEQKKDELSQSLIKLESEIKSGKLQMDNIFSKEREKSVRILKQLDSEEKSFMEEVKGLKENLAKDSDELIVMDEKATKFHSQYKGLFSKRSSIQENIGLNDISIDKLLEQSRETERKSNIFGLQLAQIKAEFAGLEKENEQYKGVSIVKDKTEDELRSEIRKFEKMVETIGSVNLKALEIYENVENEYNKLLDKKDKLFSEKEDVIAMMKEIEGKKKELFMNTYDEINRHFKEIFYKLSTKGEASLNLESPEDPFEAGLNIKVRLSGKKFMDIRSLSGGEKTMTALAFIFAIQEHDPATFYVLDEVDAALDKKNSDKLAKLVKRYAENSQYIMISHNDGIITEADNLYGVSMNEHDISQVVSLRI